MFGTEIVKDTGDGEKKKGHSTETEAARQKSSTQTKQTQREHRVTGTGRQSSCHFHSVRMPSSTARDYPLPSGQPRGKESGNVAVFGGPPRVFLLISHQWGGGGARTFVPFLACVHDTQLVFSGFNVQQILPAKFFGSTLNVVTQWLPSFRHGQKQTVVFINSCCGDSPTQPESMNCLGQPQGHKDKKQ